VTLRYVGPVSSTSSSAVAGSGGTFRAVINANGLVPGDYTVRATGSSGSTSASFTQTS